jgi:hypothetical protein
VALVSSVLLVAGVLGSCQGPPPKPHRTGPCPYYLFRSGEGQFGAEAGFDTKTFPPGGSTELRMCIHGLTPNTLTFKAPPGVTVTPPSQLVPLNAGTVPVRFTVTVEAGVAGQLRWHLGERGGSADGLGPTVASTGGGWRLEPPEL